MSRLLATSQRQVALAGLAFCALMMGVALALQYGAGLEPCPLCILQRVAVLATALVLLIAVLHGPGRRGGGVYGVVALATAASGIGVAGRHVWLQSLPADKVPSCGPGLDYMMDVLPFWDVLGRVLSGSGECAEIDGLWWGLTLPQWTLMGFVILSLFPLLMLLKSFRAR
jgi:disulfide bond formation protein DsbB